MGRGWTGAEFQKTLMACYTTYVNLSTQRSVGELELRDWDAVQVFTQQGLPGVQWEQGPADPSANI